jgi:hypothetical protein
MRDMKIFNRSLNIMSLPFGYGIDVICLHIAYINI